MISVDATNAQVMPDLHIGQKPILFDEVVSELRRNNAGNI